MLRSAVAILVAAQLLETLLAFSHARLIQEGKILIGYTLYKSLDAPAILHKSGDINLSVYILGTRFNSYAIF